MADGVMVGLPYGQATPVFYRYMFQTCTSGSNLQVGATIEIRGAPPVGVIERFNYFVPAMHSYLEASFPGEAMMVIGSSRAGVPLVQCQQVLARRGGSAELKKAYDSANQVRRPRAQNLAPELTAYLATCMAFVEHTRTSFWTARLSDGGIRRIAYPPVGTSFLLPPPTLIQRNAVGESDPPPNPNSHSCGDPLGGGPINCP